MKKLCGIYKCRFCGHIINVPVSNPVDDQKLPMVLDADQFNIDYSKQQITTWIIKDSNYIPIKMLLLENCNSCVTGLSLFDLVKVETKTEK